MIENIFRWVMAFPFKQIAQGLRGISEASDGGNVAAWIIYIVIGMLPLMWFGVKLFKKSIKVEDWLLPVISGLLYYVIYVNINPALFYVQLQIAKLHDMQLVTAGTTVHSAVLVYMVLKLVRWIRTGNKEALKKCLNIFTVASCLILLLVGLGEIEEIVNAYGARFSGDAELQVKLVVTFFAMMDAVIPELTYIVVLLSLGKAVKEYINNGMSEGLLLCVQRLEKLSAVAIAVCALVNLGYNILQLVLCRYILATSIIVYLPVIHLVSLIGVVIVSKLVLESRKYKEENELFV